MPSDRDGPIERLPTKRGVACGAVAYLLGYLVTYAVTIGRVRAELDGMQVDTALSLFGGGGVPAWKVVGWLFYNAHFVKTSVSSSSMDLSTAVLDPGTNGAGAVLFAVPPLLLVLAGALAAHLARSHGPGTAAAAGLTVLPGYFALAFLGVLGTRVGVVFAAIGPAVTPAIVAGVGYPLVFGPLGGLLAVGIQRSRIRSSPHDSKP